MVSDRMYELGNRRFVIRDIFAQAQKQIALDGVENVFDFSIGNPNVPAPQEVADALKNAMTTFSSAELHGYSNASGFPEVKEAVVDYVNKTFGMAYTANDIFMTCGAAGALVIALQALVNPGEEVVILAPYYPEYQTFADNAQAKKVIIPMDEESFQIPFDLLEQAITPNTKAILVNSPNNPSGAVYTKETILRLADILTQKSEEYGHPIYIISDEPYREIVFDNMEVPYIPKFYKNTLVCYSYSKSLSIPGHRIGYLLMPYEGQEIDSIRPAVAGSARILGFVQAPAPAQRIIHHCLGVTADMALYEKNRDVFYNGMTALGFQCVKPHGAFYMLVKSPLDDIQAFLEAGKKHNLFYAPGLDFGCPNYVRLSFCIATETIERSLVQFAKLSKDLGLTKE